jgi:hypothetical protein
MVYETGDDGVYHPLLSVSALQSGHPAVILHAADYPTAAVIDQRC